VGLEFIIKKSIPLSKPDSVSLKRMTIIYLIFTLL